MPDLLCYGGFGMERVEAVWKRSFGAAKSWFCFFRRPFCWRRPS